jgi:tetratricopeptide (TPR) repeat protein
MPSAGDNDAARAIEFGCRVLEECRALAAGMAFDHGLHLQVGIGVHSGMGVVMEELSPRGDGLRCGVAGEPLIGARRLAEAASGREVLLTAETRRLAATSRRCDGAGTLVVVEGDAPVPVFRVTPAPAMQPLESVTARQETPLTGRAAELGRLEDSWRRAELGTPAVMLLQGEAGIGKSRLVRELRRRLPAPSWIESRCAPEDQASPLRPIGTILAGLGEPLEDLLTQHEFDVPATLPLLRSIVGLPPDDRFPDPKLSAERRKELTLQLICALLVRVAHGRPLVLTIEDLHWADATTLELLQLLTDELRAASAAGERPCRVLLLLTARPEFVSPWSSSDVSLISIERLTVDLVRTMIPACVADPTAVTTELIAHVVARSDGVPLFVEELLQMLMAPDGTVRPQTESAIPSTLLGLLAARLDGLGQSAHETAQIAATLGRGFSYDLLCAVVTLESKPEWALQQDLRELLASGLLYRRAFENAYLFKHALVRDAAYEAMRPPVRRRIHGYVAQAIRTVSPAVVTERPEILAHHLCEGGDPFAASAYWHRAGESALRRASYVEAMQHLERGLAAARSVPMSRERHLRELDLLLSLGTVHFSTKGYGAAEVGDTFGAALALAGELREDPHSAKIFTGLISMYLIRGDKEGVASLMPFGRRCAESDDVVTRMTGLSPVGVHAFWQGQSTAARVALEQSQALYHTESFQRFIREYGLDWGIFSFAYSVWNDALLADVAQSQRGYAHLLEVAERSFDPNSLPLALGFGIAAAQAVGAVDETMARAQRLIERASEQRMYLWLALGQCGLGWATARQGAVADGAALLRQGLSLYQMTGALVPYAYYLSYLADVLLLAHNAAEGLVVVDEGLALCGSTLGCLPEPELVRLRGELLRVHGDDVGAETNLRQAVALARDRGARTWAFRASIGLGRLLMQRGAEDEARTIITQVRAELPSGEVLPDHADAEALLAT